MISANDWSPKLTEIKKSVFRHYSFVSSFFQHYQTCFGTCLAFWGSYWVLICTRWNLQLNCCNQSRETIKSFCLRLWRSVRLNHYLRAFSDSNVFVGFLSNSFKGRKALARRVRGLLSGAVTRCAIRRQYLWIWNCASLEQNFLSVLLYRC